jgi:hypothetical protein
LEIAEAIERFAEWSKQRGLVYWNQSWTSATSYSDVISLGANKHKLLVYARKQGGWSYHVAQIGEQPQWSRATYQTSEDAQEAAISTLFEPFRPRLGISAEEAAALFVPWSAVLGDRVGYFLNDFGAQNIQELPQSRRLEFLTMLREHAIVSPRQTVYDRLICSLI